LTPKLIAGFAVKFWSEMAGVAIRADEWRISKSTTFSREADWAMTLPKIWSPSAHRAMEKPIAKIKGDGAIRVLRNPVILRDLKDWSLVSPRRCLGRSATSERS